VSHEVDNQPFTDVTDLFKLNPMVETGWVGISSNGPTDCITDGQDDTHGRDQK
jgi:hypothetical protein